MIDLVLNLSTNTAHIREDGKTFEECNIDQIQQKQIIPHYDSIRAAADHARSSGYDLCERCFFDTHSN